MNSLNIWCSWYSAKWALYLRGYRTFSGTKRWSNVRNCSKI